MDNACDVDARREPAHPELYVSAIGDTYFLFGSSAGLM
jgi:hypothetical protein